MKIKENFLEKSFFIDIQQKILDDEFPWRKRSKDHVFDYSLYFVYNFYFKNNITSELWNSIILPILNKLEVAAILEVRANMFINKLFKKSLLHYDYTYQNSKTSILYLDTNNGGTELKIKNKIHFIKAEENKLLTFDAKTLHRSVPATDKETRYILNFNYFPTNYGKI
tara:strand:- start:43 stop:546 length:504 start_codon:yes stop_codon:yes gene_type:complete